MRSFIGRDANREYSVFVGIDEQGKTTPPAVMGQEHEQKALRLFLRRLPAGTEVVVEATGSWYWRIT